MGVKSYHKKDILDLVDAGEWQLNETAINVIRENETSGIFDIGKVYFGNYCFPLTLINNFDEIKIEYSHRIPKAQYDGGIATEKEFDINISSLYELHPVYYFDVKPGNDRYIKRKEFNQDFSNLKEKICIMLLDDALISVRDTDKIRAIRDNGNGFFKQVDMTIDNYCKKLGQKPKLTTEEIFAIARYYDNKVYEAMEYNNDGKINTVKRMLEDGFKPNQVVMISSKMESVYTGDSNWAKDILKSPEILHFRQNLGKNSKTQNCSVAK